VIVSDDTVVKDRVGLTFTDTKRRIIIQYLIEQIAQSIMNNHLSFMFLVHMSTSTRSSSETYT
jgi:predicted amino acid-binding ACT domain protein